jgi:hypothetical protein
MDHALVQMTMAEIKDLHAKTVERKADKFGAWKEGEPLVTILADVPYPSRNPRIGESLALVMQRGLWRALKPRTIAGS